MGFCSGTVRHRKAMTVSRHSAKPNALIAGWSSPVARQAHNLKAAGSNPAPATNTFPLDSSQIPKLKTDTDARLSVCRELCPIRSTVR